MTYMIRGKNLRGVTVREVSIIETKTGITYRVIWMGEGSFVVLFPGINFKESTIGFE